MLDVTFPSASLHRDMPYRVILPASIPVNQKLAVAYLLHGGGGGYRDWSNYSDVTRFAEQSLVLVMREGNSSYYVNAAERPQDRSEDYITKDLIRNVESRFPAASGRENRAIIGVSMGGFGAVVLALKHPDLFAFAGGMSSALDVPTRRFSLRRVAQYRAHAQIFGPWGSETRITSNPYHLAESVDPAKTPICISLAESKKACFRRMRDSQPCSEIMGSNTNSILALEVTIGISGTADSPD
jgi:S-formylglutathione hydrolase FrmB